MKTLGLTASMMMLACGARGNAKPADVEIEWPDSGVVTTVGQSPISPADAGVIAPVDAIQADAMPNLETPR